MNESVTHRLGTGLLALANNAPNGYWQMEIPNSDERTVALIAQQTPPMSAEQVAELRSALVGRTASVLDACSKRMASWAVRTRDTSLLELAIFLLVVDDNNLNDWRDILTSLSWIDYCATLLGVRLEDLVSNVIGLAAASRRLTIEGYLSREPALRTPEGMGLAPVGAGPTFHFRWLP